MLEEEPAGRRWPDTARRALEETHAVLALERGDPLRCGRRRVGQCLRGPAEGAAASDLAQHEQCLQIEQ